MTKQIPLTQGLFATVDDEDFSYLMQWNWFALKSRSKFYAVRNEKDINRKYVYMHRVIMDTPDELEPDHIDGDGLNNTRANLRNSTHTQNAQNKKKNSNSLSDYKGVHWYRGKWQAQITINKQKVFLGRFSTSQEAAHAYDKAARNYFGEYARLNFPER